MHTRDSRQFDRSVPTTWVSLSIALCALVGDTTPASADVVFEDGDFSNWSSSFVGDGGSSATMTIRPTGGNPGFYLESQTTTGANQGVNHLLINEDIVWTPASDGELLNLTLELDHLGGNQGYQLLVLQDGVFYIAPGWGHATGGHQAWTALATLGPSEDSDFVAVIGAYAVDPDVHPDFSTNGSPLQFGFATANFSSGGVVGSYDNWRVTVSVVPAPPAAALLICGALPFARRRR